MRLAGKRSIKDALNYSFGNDSGEEDDDDLDTFMETYELLKSKGYSNSAASDVAERMTLKQEPMAKKSTRFAQIYDDAPIDDREGSSTA